MRIAILALLIPLLAFSQDRKARVDELLVRMNYAGARQQAQALLDETTAAGKADQLEGAEALELLATTEIRGGNSGPVVTKLLENAATIKQRLAGADSLPMARNIELRAMQKDAASDYRAAIVLYGQAVALQTKLQADSLTMAASLGLLSNSMRQGGREAESIGIARKSLQLRLTANAPERLIGESHANLALCLSKSAPDNWPEAWEEFQLAITLLAKTAGPYHPMLGRLYGNIGSFFNEKHDYVEARKYHERALGILEKELGPDSPRLVAPLNNLGLALKDLGEYPAAKKTLERARAISEKRFGIDHSNTATVEANLGIVLKEMGDYLGALHCYEKARVIQEKRLGPDHQFVGSLTYSLANLHDGLGNHAEAETLVARALKIFITKFGETDPRSIQALRASASLNSELGRLSLAKQQAQKALELTLKNPQLDSAVLIMAQHGLAAVLFKLKDFDGAKAQMDEALLARSKKTDVAQLPLAAEYDMMGQILEAQGEHKKAIVWHEKAIDQLSRIAGPNSTSLPGIQENLAKALAGDGRRAEALAAVLESQRLQEDHLRLAARGLSERQALLFAKKRTNRLDLMMSLIDSPQDKQAVWNRLILSRASILDESSERARRWRREPDPEAAAIWDELTQARTNLAALVIHGPSESSHDFLSKVEQARTVKEQLERNLAERSQSFRGELERDRAGLADVQSKLPVKSAVVAYFAAENLYAFITGADGEVHTQTLGSTASINKLVAAWRKEINRERDSIGRNAAKNEQSYRAASAALRKAVWDPVSRYAGKAELVFLVPDGQLQIVNFASLAVGDSAYLAERGPVLHILTTERDLIQPALPPQQVTKTVLAVGNPAYDTKAAPQMLAKRFRGAVSTCSDFQSLRFEALPASGREAEVVTAISKRQGLTTTLLTGAGATESAVKETIRGQRIVHIATHGFFLDQACRNNPAAQENPLLRAGLVFSGANQRSKAGEGQEDGILTAEEAASLDLDGTEWLVLSGCDTATGELQGSEGVMGLRRSFQIAGARTILATLWSVEDEDARRWITSLYQARLVRKAGSARAVAAANQQELARRRAAGITTHPFHWASFVAAGDWR